MKQHTQAGFSKPILFIVIILVAIATVAGYIVFSSSEVDAPAENQNQADSQASQQPAANTPAPTENTPTEQPADQRAKSFTVDAFDFGYSLSEITVNPGDVVTINLTNSGGSHDLVIDELDVATKVISSGQTDSVTFTVPESAAGQSYEFYCSVGNHRAQGMFGTITITN